VYTHSHERTALQQAGKLGAAEVLLKDDDAFDDLVAAIAEVLGKKKRKPTRTPGRSTRRPASSGR
jgi:DNA-binding NarL/FixJ family response regulator